MKSDESKKVKVALEHIRILLEGLNSQSFQVSIAGSSSIKAIAKDLEKMDATAKIGSVISERLNKEMEIFERIIHSESSTKLVYLVSSGRFNAEYLTTSPSKLFKENIFNNLSEMAKFDFSSSCRCILFGEGTAAAFHILRATEDTLKKYYHIHKKTKRLTKPMWGPMTAELRSKKTNRPPIVLLDTLDMVRNSYRNPTQHPESKYDINEAQDLFGVCLDLIGKMAAEL
ncbi:MAG TPA: hypothetical protein VNV60_08250 [Holophagaceae bacterium]|nr:hypothetical protein [Holophagaceae bacterium]